MNTTRAALAAALLLTFGATACSNDSTTHTAATPTTVSSAALPSGVNAADVIFAQQMIPHHQQAVEMSKAVLDRGQNSEVRSLAEQISGAQDPEITTMKGWLTTWGQPEAAGKNDGMDGMDGMDHSTDETMVGMMSSDEMTMLGAESGAKLDALYVELMIKHHQGAITMAEKQVADGKDPGAIALAKAIIVAQQGEISTMNQLLPTLTSS